MGRLPATGTAKPFLGDLLEMMQAEYAQRLDEWAQRQPQARAAMG